MRHGVATTVIEQTVIAPKRKSQIYKNMCALLSGSSSTVVQLMVLIAVLSAPPTSESAKLPARQHPAGVDFFEHEFTSLAADEYDPYGPDIGDDDLGIDDPETMPRLFQGDIAIDPYTYITLRLGVNPMRHPKRLWPNGTIPFEISPRYAKSGKAGHSAGCEDIQLADLRAICALRRRSGGLPAD